MVEDKSLMTYDEEIILRYVSLTRKTSLTAVAMYSQQSNHREMRARTR